MQPWRALWLLALVLLALLSAGATAAEKEERAAWRLWQAQAAEAPAPAAMDEACRRAAEEMTNSPLAALAPALQAWYAMSTGGTHHARALLAGLESGPETPMGAAMSECARRWLTRLDRERVASALRAYYLKHVGYPDSLEVFDSLPDSERPPLNDRWKTPWRYRLSVLRHVPGLADQRYVLESTRLGKSSALAPLARLPYPARPPLVPRQAARGDAGSATVTFETAGEAPQKVAMTQGGRHGSVTLAYVGEKILVLCDGDFWYVLPIPGGG